MIVLAVKPQIIDDVLPTLASAIGPYDGGAVDRRRAHACQSRVAVCRRAAAIVRAMPNTPAAIGQGMTVACASGEVTPRPGALCNMLLEAVGDVIWMDDEA